ncbi:hypothetical protein V1512DRAFT_240302 [Lipomyces arxii]|uniref:uncharacterized protein n=1 Tax=Lipomyces arxii TaxID=56418 RepID=UPI0034CE5DD1
MASCSDTMEFYLEGSNCLVNVSTERYNELVKSSTEPPLFYYDEEGDPIKVGSSLELRDRISELKFAHQPVFFCLSSVAGREWIDDSCENTLIVKLPIPVYDLNDGPPQTEQQLEIPRPTSTFSGNSYFDVPTPEGLLSAAASSAGDEPDQDIVESGTIAEDHFADSLAVAFENMLNKPNMQSHITPNSATVSVTAASESAGSTSTGCPMQSYVDRSTHTDHHNWPDLVFENIKRGVKQLQEVAGGGSASIASKAGSGPFYMDPSLPESVAELVRRSAHQTSANIQTANQTFSTASNLGSTADRTFTAFQDFAAQIGHIAILGSAQAAAASREAAELWLQATREALLTAKENTQEATSQLQACLREIATQFNETQNHNRQSRESAGANLARQVSETWNKSKSADEGADVNRTENKSSRGSVLTPSRSSTSEYFDALSREEARPSIPQAVPPLPRKIPIQESSLPKFGVPPRELDSGRPSAFRDFHYQDRHHPFGNMDYAPFHEHWHGAYMRHYRNDRPLPPTFTLAPPFVREPHILDLPINAPPHHFHHRHERSGDFHESGVPQYPYPARVNRHYFHHNRHGNHESHADRLGVGHRHYNLNSGDRHCADRTEGFEHIHGPSASERNVNFGGRSRGRGYAGRTFKTPRFGHREPDLVGSFVPTMNSFTDRGFEVDSAGAEGSASILPPAPPVDLLSDEGQEWDRVATQLHSSAPLASAGDAIKEFQLQDEEFEAERARYLDDLRIANTAQVAPISTYETETFAEPDPWDANKGYEASTPTWPLSIPPEQYRSSPGGRHQYNPAEIEGVLRGLDPLGSLSRASSYNDGPGMPPSPQKIMQREGIVEEAYTPGGRAYMPTTSGPDSRASRPSQFIGQDRAKVVDKIRDVRRRHGVTAGAPRATPRPQTYIEMHTIRAEAQSSADINRLGLENSATKAERECARQLVELELITPENIALAIYYAQQAKGEVFIAIDLIEEDLNQSETYEAQNKPVADNANPLADEDELYD